MAPRDEVKHPNAVACDSMWEGGLCTCNERLIVGPASGDISPFHPSQYCGQFWLNGSRVLYISLTA